MADDHEMDEPEVHLGFLEEPRNVAEITSPYFPSKAGGMPAWLDLKDLPLTSQLACPACGDPMVFLLQLYSPLEDRDECFHRTIFLFFCANAGCQHTGSQRFKALRCQLPRKNAFYAYDPPPEDPAEDEVVTCDPLVPVCAVCGCRGPNRCSGCKVAAYCSRAHQLRHWREGHKEQCKGQKAASFSKSSALLPEFEIVNEPEDIEEDGDPEDAEEDRLRDYEEAVRALDAQRAKEGVAPLDKEDVPFDDKDVQKDVEFLRFQKRIKHNPEQIVRYVREVPDGAVWVSDEGKPGVADIPPCAACGAPRQLEFQVLPQVLYLLKIEHDWGLLSVYACSNSCGGNATSAYSDEFVWPQSVSEKAAYRIPAQPAAN